MPVITQVGGLTGGAIREQIFILVMYTLGVGMIFELFLLIDMQIINQPEISSSTKKWMEELSALYWVDLCMQQCERQCDTSSEIQGKMIGNFCKNLCTHIFKWILDQWNAAQDLKRLLGCGFWCWLMGLAVYYDLLNKLSISKLLKMDFFPGECSVCSCRCIAMGWQ